MRVHNRIPSQRALVAAFGPEAGKCVRRLLDGRTDPATVPETAAWIAQCFNRPRVSELEEVSMREATQQEIENLARLQRTFPFRICYLVLHDNGESQMGADHNRRKMLKYARAGATVLQVQRGA